VVKFHSVNVLTKEEPCFLFEHPQARPLIEMTKHCNLSFTIPHDTLLHGFAGYFDSKLYGDVHISM
jgi:protein arginine N-methyltransferase 5